MRPQVSRRRLIKAGLACSSLATLAGCGYRPGGGDVRFEIEPSGLSRPDDLLATDGTLFTVVRSERGFDWDSEEWGSYSYVTAYDATSGTELWEHDGPPVGKVATDGRTIYLGTKEGDLTALDTDGGTRWQTTVGDFPRTLAASNGRVYALTDAGELVAFGAKDGEQSWRKEIEQGGTRQRAAITAIRRGVLVHHQNDGAANAVAAIRRNGNPRWKTELPASRDAGDGPVVADGTAYVSTGRDLFALSLDDGTERWSKRVGFPRGPPVVGNGTLYYVDEGDLHALDAEDGAVRWRSKSMRWGGFTTSPAVADGAVFVGSDEAVTAVDASDGSRRWRVENEGVSSEPLVVGPAVVVVSGNGYVRGHWRES